MRFEAGLMVVQECFTVELLTSGHVRLQSSVSGVQGSPQGSVSA